MDLRQYVRVLRAHRKLIALSVLACIGIAALLAWTRDPIYSADTQLFVSTGSTLTDPSQSYQGGLFSQQRVRSYARIVSTPPLVGDVVRQLGLTKSVKDVQNEISASVPTDTVLIDVTVEDKSPKRAAAIANAVGTQFPKYVEAIEKPRRGAASPVKVSVTSPAEVPTSPISPRKPLYLALGAFLGLILGIGGSVLRELLDSRVREGRDVAAVLGAPVVGLIPKQRRARKRPLVMVGDPSSSAAEAYRRLRTNIRALSADHSLRSFVVSSALPGEGKTLTVANLGLAFAQAGHRVILVDGDMRAPRLAELFELDSTLGLSNVLVNNMPVEDALQRYDALPLEVLPSGPPPPNPSELLGSERFARVLSTLTNRAEIVIVDAPALLPVTDAAILAQLTAGVILMARASSTSTSHLESAVQSLGAVDKHVVGVVLNGTPAGNGKPYGTYRPPQRVSAKLPSRESF